MLGSPGGFCTFPGRFRFARKPEDGCSPLQERGVAWEALRPADTGVSSVGAPGAFRVLECSETGPFLLLLGRWRPRRAHFHLRDIPGWARTSPWSQEGVWQEAEEGGAGPLTSRPCPGLLCPSGVIHVLELASPLPPPDWAVWGVSASLTWTEAATPASSRRNTHGAGAARTRGTGGRGGPGGGDSVCRAASRQAPWGDGEGPRHRTIWCTGWTRQCERL